MSNVCCRGCGFDSGIPRPSGGFAVAEYVKKTGMHWVPCHEGKDLWLCNACRSSAKEHAEAIKKICGTDLVPISSLLRQ